MKTEDIIQAVEAISQEMIAGIKKIVQIDSVQGSPLADAPFGPGPKLALEQVLAISAKLGFLTKNIDNYMGYASFGPRDDKHYIAVIGHLDVVPVGEGWRYPPFSAHEEDGVIYSRGILDNKGPIIACLYALAALKRMGFKPKREIRIIFGTNEENGFNDLKYYLKKERPPIAGFTPDCKYPVVYAERGRANVKISFEQPGKLYDFMNTFILNSFNQGERLKINYSNEEFGTLELRNFQLKEMEGKQLVYFSISYPFGITLEEIVEKIQENGPFDLEVELNYNPVFFDKKAPMIKIMQEVYEKVTGENGKPVTTTGGTYAKLMPNIVPFGPSFPGQKGIGHNPNEWMKVEDLITNAKIYALTIYRLGTDREII